MKLKVKLKSPVKIQSHAAEMKHRRWDETCLAEMKLNHRWIETRMTHVIEGFTRLGTSTVDKADVVHGSFDRDCCSSVERIGLARRYAPTVTRSVQSPAGYLGS